MADKSGSKFGTGLLIGAIIGGLSAFFLSPKTGKENQKLFAKKLRELQDSLNDLNIEKKVKEIFGESGEEAIKMYKAAKKDLAKRLEGIKDQIEDFDHEKYVAMVEDVIDDVKGQMKTSAKHVEKLKGYLLDNWDTVTDSPDKKKSKKKA